MNETERKNIEEEILQSGFALEIKTQEVLVKNGWIVNTQSRYYDSIREKVREIDLVCEKFHYDSAKKNVINSHVLVIECKKEHSAPWVFLEQPDVKADRFSLNIITPKGTDVFYRDYQEKGCGHYFKEGPIYTCHLVPFKKNKEGENTSIDESKKSREAKKVEDAKMNALESAIDQVTSALFFLAERDENFLTSLQNKYLTFLFPVIVFDGKLIGAKISGKEVLLEEKNHIRRLINYEFREPNSLRWDDQKSISKKTKPIIIDIVHIDHLQEFLKNF
jgi:hypothetical protein